MTRASMSGDRESLFGFAADADPPYGDDSGPPDCPGMGMDDLCTWPDIEGCGLCTLGMNPETRA